MAKYSEQNKNEYLKYFRATMPKYKKTGKPEDKPLTFGRWRDGGPKEDSKKTVTKTTEEKAKIQKTARTSGVRSGLKRAGIKRKEMKSDDER